MNASEEFFGGQGVVERARDGSPLIIPPGGIPGVKVPYTRASSLPGFIADQRHIHDWRDAHLVKAMGQNLDLARLAAQETYNTGFGEKDDRQNAASKKRLLDIRDRGLDRVGIMERADWGTAFHMATEPYAPAPADPLMRKDVLSFMTAMRIHEIQPVATECFVVCDQIRSAGTFDHLVTVAGHNGIFVLDKKTGRQKSAQEWAIQLAVYANGALYDTETGDRGSLEDAVRTDLAIVSWTLGQSGQTELFWVDIAAGWQAARCAAWVRDWQDRTDLLGKF